MKPRPIYLRTLCASLALVTALAVWIPLQSLRADPPEGKTMPRGGMMGADGTTMEQQRKMMSDMMAQDTELTELVAKMNKAPQSQKVDLLADIVTRLVANQTARHAQMQSMHARMRGSMPMDPDAMHDGMMNMDDKDAVK